MATGGQKQNNQFERIGEGLGFVLTTGVVLGNAIDSIAVGIGIAVALGIAEVTYIFACCSADLTSRRASYFIAVIAS